MIFSTPIFVFAFLPAFLAVYTLTPPRWRNTVLVVASCIFYGWWKAAYLALVLGIAGLSYVAGAVAVYGGSHARRVWAVRIGVLGNLLLLAWFKYAYFLAGSYDAALERLGVAANAGISLPEIILPIGLSFLVFQSISYILDVSRGDARPARRLMDFLAFSTLFPQLIAGPILRYKDLSTQLAARRHSLALFLRGARRFIAGLAMKLLVADSVAPLADRIFALPDPTLAEAWLGAVAYAIQLFFDFAGYSAMAIGLGLMIGFRFVENFNAPYISRSVTEFWRRWHISLSNWLRDYLYIPLGGNRDGAVRTYRNLILTMVLGGLWHGANWTFVLWGAWHGCAMAVERALGAKRGQVWPRGLAWPLTMGIVLVGWVMFRAESVGHAVVIYAGMAGANGVAFTPETLMLIRPTEIICLAIGVALALAPALDGLPKGVSLPIHWVSYFRRTVQPVLLFCLCGLIMQARADSPFLYFQF